MNLYPNYIKDFHCIGDKCNNTCCAGWDVSIDENTLKKYQNIPGEFGDFVRENLSPQEDGNAFVKMPEDFRCPFLNESGLCNVYINCGEDYLSKTCTNFPRLNADVDGEVMRLLSLSCEEVLHIIKNSDEPIVLQAQNCKKDGYFYELSQIIKWALDMIQNEDIPLSVALSTVLYTFLEIGDDLNPTHYDHPALLHQISNSIFNEFSVARLELSEEEIEIGGWDLIFNVINTFCTIVNEGCYLPQERALLWNEDFFSLKDSARKEKLYKAWKKRTMSAEQVAFLRKLYSAFLLNRCRDLIKGLTPKEIFTDLFANYVLLTNIFPIVWDCSLEHNPDFYFSRLAGLCRVFEQTKAIPKFVAPILDDLYEPDVVTYAMAFMHIFG